MGDDTFAARYKQTTFLETNGYSAFDPNDCEEFCRDKGYNYFGYGCARTNYIYCWCHGDEMVVSEPETKRCKYVDQNTRRLDKCNGPNELQGLDLGGYKIGSVYKIPGSNTHDSDSDYYYHNYGYYYYEARAPPNPLTYQVVREDARCPMEGELKWHPWFNETNAPWLNFTDGKAEDIDTTMQMCFWHCKKEDGCNTFSFGEETYNDEIKKMEGKCILCKADSDLEEHAGFTSFEIVYPTDTTNDPVPSTPGASTLDRNGVRDN